MRTDRHPVVVVGSCNLDQVLRVRRFPDGGETVGAHSLHEEAGGKGLNQAIAAARMGSPVSLIASIGQDPAAEAVLASLSESGVDTSLVSRAPGSTGRAVVMVDDEHDNRIIVAPCANGSMLALDGPQREAIAKASAVLLQLEIPIGTVTRAAQIAAAAGVPVGLTPAPVRDVPRALLEATSILFANENEAAELSGTSDIDRALERLLELVPEVLITRGSRGSDYASRDGARLHCAARTVPVLDTTAAGDAYAGVFTAVRGRGHDVRTAMAIATAAASIAVQRAGSSSAIPTRAEVEALAQVQLGAPYGG